MSSYFNGLWSSKPAKQQQDDQYDQNDAAKPHSGVAHAVAVAAEPAAEAAQQGNNQDDNQNRSKRHRHPPQRAPAEWNPPPRQPEQSIPSRFVPPEEPETSIR